MDFNETLDIIKSRGYWLIHFHPVGQSKMLISTLAECKALAQRASVSLRGWDFPHIAMNDVNDDLQQCYVKGDRVEEWVNWGYFKEVWRLYQNGNSVYINGIYDDWYNEDHWFSNEITKKIKPLTALNFIEVIYRLTELVVFLKNLINENVYSSDLVLKVGADEN